VINAEMIFLHQKRVRVRRSREGNLQLWCRFNASVSVPVREGETVGQSVAER
jgi:hypothetical protein